MTIDVASRLVVLHALVASRESELATLLWKMRSQAINTEEAEMSALHYAHLVEALRDLSNQIREYGSEA
jgi:hypothetical protein